MEKVKYLLMAIIVIILSFCTFNISKATEIDVTRNIYSNNGSMKFNFTGLTLDTTHQYEFGLTKTKADEVGTWHQITEYTTSTVVVDIISTTTDLRDVIDYVDIGYITIKDKTENKIIIQSHSVDLKIPYLRLTNYSVIPNGKKIDEANSYITIPLRKGIDCKAYYKYEKITDQNIINKYKEIKSKGEDILKLESMLKTTIPNSNWNTWKYYNGINDVFGYTQRNVYAPDTGLYYMWVYLAQNNLKNIYGYILVDNLQPDIALEGISLPKTRTIELGKTVTLIPTYNPENATNKIITWSSSDETVATVDNAGKVTAKKIGSSIITAISQDGNKKATCTVTVYGTGSNNNQSSNTGNNNINNSNSNNSNSVPSKKKDDKTTVSGRLPQAGVGFRLTFIIVLLIGGSIFVYIKYSRLKEI